jgi:hypothetical protein
MEFLNSIVTVVSTHRPSKMLDRSVDHQSQQPLATGQMLLQVLLEENGFHNLWLCQTRALVSKTYLARPCVEQRYEVLRGQRPLDTKGRCPGFPLDDTHCQELTTWVRLQSDRPGRSFGQ